MNKVEELYNLYYTKVYSYVLVISKDKNVTEEITQSTFFKSIRCINQFRGDCDISTWLCSIAKNLYFDYIKKQKKIVGINENMADDENILCYLCDKEQAFSIHRILHNLEDPYKEVFTLRVFGELSFIEIGRLFEKTDNWARVTYYRAKLKIQDEMGDKVGKSKL